MRNLIVFLLAAVFSQASAGAVEEYLFCFPPNFREAGPTDVSDRNGKLDCSVSIGTVSKANIRIRIPALSFDTAFAVNERSSARVQLPETVIPKKTGLSSNSIVITSDVPIGVTAKSHRFQATETYAVHPASRLGRSYVISSYSKLAQDLMGLFSIIGTTDGTMIHVRGPQNCAAWDRTLADGIDIRLDRGQVWTYVAPFSKTEPADPTGTLITSTQPVSIISGHSCAYVPVKWCACNPLYEQLLPISTFGATTFVPPLYGRAGSNVRVMATAQASKVVINGNITETIPEQGFSELSRDVNEPLELRADSPVQVALFGRGFTSIDSTGDPCMIMIPSTDQYAREQLVTTISEPNWNQYVTIICPPGHSSEVLINGTIIPVSTFTTHASGFRFACVLSAPGSHIITSEKPVGLFVHGIGTGMNVYDAYGTGGSMIIKK
ncbi:MAG: IgGFc-binding protein [Candidatus Kapabacteria bacterium]|nr:IgGFc-binding protein [Candidatus Kapabacteria bacterium]